MNIQILLILSLVGFGSTGLIPVEGLSEAVGGLTGGIKNVLSGIGSGVKVELPDNAKLAELFKELATGLETGKLTPEEVILNIQKYLLKV
ncbi:hypothetical protein B9Z55_003178 [Caenorhabditis nigoni]|uniref:SXP/RAL-2 family protein Ani s 5-like cation-binding domain-containing protein n=1 Tax=Caenorhabditis nigoni TaxID=1611254 RepID=A0A2G5VPC2_9PELO|nr:hypothetical protein B9Z55_003178 [Caenorhabditis nigoni]